MWGCRGAPGGGLQAQSFLHHEELEDAKLRSLGKPGHIQGSEPPKAFPGLCRTQRTLTLSSSLAFPPLAENVPAASWAWQWEQHTPAHYSLVPCEVLTRAFPISAAFPATTEVQAVVTRTTKPFVTWGLHWTPQDDSGTGTTHTPARPRREPDPQLPAAPMPWALAETPLLQSHGLL